VGRKRHLIFMTEEQMKCLKSTVRWYVDGTFKIIDKPFFVFVNCVRRLVIEIRGILYGHLYEKSKLLYVL
jgi:hypothetical protein